MPINLCLVGLGYMGKIHLEKLLHMEDVKVSVVVDINKKIGNEISNTYKLPFFSDYKEAFKAFGDIQGVVISSPTDTHHEIATYFIEKGVHVFIEKPMVKDTKEADSIVKLAKKKDIIVQVGHLERFNPAFKKALEYIKNPVMIEARRTGPYTGRSTDIDVIFDLMIHDIDLMIHLNNEKLDCNARAYGMRLINDSFDAATAILEFENGFKGILYANRVSTRKERSLTVFENDRIVYTDLLNGTVTVMTKKQDKNLEFIEHNTGKIDSVKEELKEFVDVISNNKLPTIQGIDGLKAVKLAELIRSSIEV
ncbi:MAG TPA: Gfo/Idh/MocA family oxidoreductase [Syntrophorhabdaceae bacterium]|nr:Gfo/Idh/MocA family oxidoreductase [Syntrophorhabdaceae bacterium]